MKIYDGHFSRISSCNDWHEFSDIQSIRSPALTPEDLMVVRECDLYNHNHDGGLWIVINGKVYDVQDFKSQKSCNSDMLECYAGKDATQVRDLRRAARCGIFTQVICNITFQAFFSVNHSLTARDMMNSYLVGSYLEDNNPDAEREIVRSPLMDAERTLGYLLGLHSYWLTKGTCLQPAEEEAKLWLNSTFLQGGLHILQPPNPFEEEKGEVRSATSTAGL